MKVCPICKARCFDDMDICFGCLHRFEDDDRNQIFATKAMPVVVAAVSIEEDGEVVEPTAATQSAETADTAAATSESGETAEKSAAKESTGSGTSRRKRRRRGSSGKGSQKGSGKCTGKDDAPEAAVRLGGSGDSQRLHHTEGVDATVGAEGAPASARPNREGRSGEGGSQDMGSPKGESSSVRDGQKGATPSGNAARDCLDAVVSGGCESERRESEQNAACAALDDGTIAAVCAARPLRRDAVPLGESGYRLIIDIRVEAPEACVEVPEVG